VVFLSVFEKAFSFFFADVVGWTDGVEASVALEDTLLPSVLSFADLVEVDAAC
jgi:hypothetical protein